MPRLPRRELFEDAEVGVYHCINRCVRRAFLCGKDAVTGRDFEHRKVWIRRRLEFLAGRFGLDILSYTVMANHVHVILRNRPDIVTAWSDEEVARRWWELFPLRKGAEGNPAEPDEAELSMITSDPDKLRERRRRLSDVSWFMRCLCEPIARQANKEDKCTGRFWEGRFKCQRLLDESALLACSVYVDLNPIRAGIAKTPETSEFTSAKDRIQGERLRREPRRASRKGSPRAARHSAQRRAAAPSWPDRWLSPVELAKELNQSAGKSSPRNREASSAERASNQGFLPVSLTQYLKLLDWTGRQARQDKRGVIPAELRPILDRIGLSTETWVETVLNFGRWFRRAAGRVESLSAEATKRGRRWLHGLSHCRQAFA